MSFLDGMDYDEFAKGFLETYLADGFANLPKSEIDLLNCKREDNKDEN